jgi:HD-like signal output (HDOD) protein
MGNTTPHDIESWVRTLSEREIPVLRQTARSLEEARLKSDQITGRDIALIALRDPLMTVRVLAFIRPYHGKHHLKEITSVEHAVMMLGIEPFFRHFEKLAVIEDQLKPHPQALLGLLHVLRRAQRAARYALDWALTRRDLNVEEITVAALLHDLAEILMWCFAPQESLQIRAMQQADRTLRSADAQTAVYGFRLIDLQLALCKAWKLPELLLNLLDDANREVPRVKNVALAVNLARHSANGWDDAALPDDYAEIAKLLNLDSAAVMARLGLTQEGEPAPPQGGA